MIKEFIYFTLLCFGTDLIIAAKNCDQKQCPWTAFCDNDTNECVCFGDAFYYEKNNKCVWNKKSDENFCLEDRSCVVFAECVDFVCQCRDGYEDVGYGNYLECNSKRWWIYQYEHIRCATTTYSSVIHVVVGVIIVILWIVRIGNYLLMNCSCKKIRNDTGSILKSPENTATVIINI